MISSQFKALALSACVMLSACGGGGDDPPEDVVETISSIPCPGAKTVKVQLFGDSTQEGYAGSSGVISTNAPAAMLQRAMDRRYGVGRAVVTGRAISGSTAQELLAGTDGRNFPWPTPVDADVVVLNHGMNDAIRYGAGRIGEYESTLQTLIDKTPAGTVMILETPNAATVADLTAYAGVMREVAQKNGVAIADAFAYTSSLPNLSAMLPDGQHPSSELYKAIALNSLIPAVFKVTDRALCQ